MADTREHNIVMFPFMAQGHIIPFLSLALHLQKTTRSDNLSITFINTHHNIKNLKRSLPSDSSIRLVEIPFNGSDHGLPENFDSHPYHLLIHLLHASTSLKEPFRRLLSDFIRNRDGEKPICVIGDIFFGWMGGVCRELGVFHVIFSGAGGYGIGCYYSMWLNLPHKKVDDDDDGDNKDEFYLPDFREAGKFHKTQLPTSLLEANGEDLWSNFMSKNFLEWFDSDGILFNTVGEFDQIGLSYFSRKLGLPVWPIGPILLSNERKTRAGRELGIEHEFLKGWLDSKPKNSVLYVSFGSMNTISLSHMQQLAMALETCGKNFIWVVRPPIGFESNGDFESRKWLPEGFEERIKESGRGLLVKKWAPQVEILSHGSVSAFLSHCGWNSVLEALSFGVPLIAWAMAGEQFFNAKLLVEEVNICVEVARGKSCEVKHKDIAEKINLVMEDTEKGREMRRKANEAKEMIKNAMRDDDVKGSSVRSMDEFLSAAMLRKKMSDDAIDKVNQQKKKILSSITH